MKEIVHFYVGVKKYRVNNDRWNPWSRSLRILCTDAFTPETSVAATSGLQALSCPECIDLLIMRKHEEIRKLTTQKIFVFAGIPRSVASGKEEVPANESSQEGNR